MGGTVAYEMACQLEEAGKTVVFVAMFDSWAGYSGAFKDKARFEQDVARQQEAYAEQLQVLDQKARDTLMAARWGLMQLLTAYQPKHSNLVLHVYKASQLNEMHATNEDLADNGWQQYSDKPTEVYLIDGDHESIHSGQGLIQICEFMNGVLE